MKGLRERTSLVFFGLAALSVALGSYMIMWSSRLSISVSGHVSSAAIPNACLPGQISAIKKENPNKMLFITCGGFLD